MTLPIPLRIAIEQGTRVHEELRASLDHPLDLTRSPINIKIGAALCRLAINHGRGLTLLMKEVMPGPAAVLLRPQREVLLRAIWASRLANDHELSVLADWKDQQENAEPDFPKMHVITRAMSDREELSSISESLEAIQRLFRRHMNSHPHGGLRAVQQVMGGGFDWLLAVNNLKAASAQSILAARHVADILDNDAMREAVHRVSVWPEHWLRE